MWMEEIAYFKKFCDDNQMPRLHPNSMNNYGVILDDFGFEKILD
jgi:hypothetical protein